MQADRLFIRRTGSLLFDISWTQKWMEPVIDYMASVLNWSDQEKEQHASELEQEIERATQPQTRPQL